jgi:hypothetical protein
VVLESKCPKPGKNCGRRSVRQDSRLAPRSRGSTRTECCVCIRVRLLRVESGE